MMKTYAEILAEKEKEKMTNYDMDELRRQGKVPNLERNADYDGALGQTDGLGEPKIDYEKRREFAQDIINSEESEAAVTVELPDDVVLKLALQAHERDITLNKMCGIVLKDSLKNLEYRYEHQSKPQVLKEY